MNSFNRDACMPAEQWDEFLVAKGAPRADVRRQQLTAMLDRLARSWAIASLWQLTGGASARSNVPGNVPNALSVDTSVAV